MERRGFLVRTGLLLGARAFAPALRPLGAQAPDPPSPDVDSWAKVKALFELDPRVAHLSSFFLCSHPRPVREAIERLRRDLDANPIRFFFENEERLEAATLQAAAEYMGVKPAEIALTDSTTMGLGLLYTGLKLRPQQEILTTTHDHYSTETSLRLLAERTGARVRSVSLYSRPETASLDQIVSTLSRSLRPTTRFVCVTWVHSSSGVKLPIRAMAAAIADANRGRAPKDRALLCVDGVHGFGAENTRVADLGCDFFIAGCHKWILGPRGTGLVWGSEQAWAEARPTIPTFDAPSFGMWMGVRPAAARPLAVQMTPGGFHAFEHRWALEEAFKLHGRIGQARIESRIHELNSRLKDGLASIPKVVLRTPRDAALSSGITCFEIDGLSAEHVATGLAQRHRVMASVAPYRTLYARLAPSLVNDDADIDAALRGVRALAG